MEYNYIVIEGNIGAGKTSLVNKLGEDLNAKVILERFAENPFLPKFYEDPERFSFPVELSFLADRYHQLKEELSNRDIFSRLVLADYYFSKSLIFARITLKDDEFNLYRQLYDIIHQHLPLPDLYVYLHVPVSRLQENIKMRGRDYEQNIDSDYLLDLQNGYFEYLKSKTEMRTLLIDAGNINYINNQSDYIKIKNCIFNTQYKAGINRIIL
ncbi:MAG: deoxynucleoside kinase [Bacteroidales bacterium]|nr:deoxynucleoside kinase [Bacteroidales bacterium]MCB8999895.1 deoxynucleoside kinase [Bacteroidales bacterium]